MLQRITRKDGATPRHSNFVLMSSVFPMHITETIIKLCTNKVY